MSRSTSRAAVEVAPAQGRQVRGRAHLGVQVHLEVVVAAMGALEAAVRARLGVRAQAQVAAAVEVAVARHRRMQKASAI